MGRILQFFMCKDLTTHGSLLCRMASSVPCYPHLMESFRCLLDDRLYYCYRGYLSRDVRLCLRLIVVNPEYDVRTVGFETINRMKAFGTQNAVSYRKRQGRGGCVHVDGDVVLSTSRSVSAALLAVLIASPA